MVKNVNMSILNIILLSFFLEVVLQGMARNNLTEK